MSVYIFLVLIIACGVLYSVKERSKYENIYIYIVFFAMLAIVGLRSIELGLMDTQFVYVPNIQKYINTSISYIMENRTKDPVFFVLTTYIAKINPNIHFILFIISIPYLLSVSCCIKKYSKIPWLSFIVFLGLTYFTLSFNILRQVIAIAFTTYSYKYLENRNLIKFVCVVFVASLFHQTALIFLIAYPIVNLRVGMKQWLVIIISLIISFIMKNSFISYIIQLLSKFLKDDNRYSAYESKDNNWSYVAFLVQLILFICITIWYQRKTENQVKINFKSWKIIIHRYKNEKYDEHIMLDNRMEKMYNLCTINLMLLSLSSILGEFSRLAAYFGIFNIILLPNAVSYIESKSLRLTVEIGIAIMLILYFLIFGLENAGVVPYKFYWQ